MEVIFIVLCCRSLFVLISTNIFFCTILYSRRSFCDGIPYSFFPNLFVGFSTHYNTIPGRWLADWLVLTDTSYHLQIQIHSFDAKTPNCSIAMTDCYYSFNNFSTTSSATGLLSGTLPSRRRPGEGKHRWGRRGQILWALQDSGRGSQKHLDGLGYTLHVQSGSQEIRRRRAVDPAYPELAKGKGTNPGNTSGRGFETGLL